MLKSLFIKNYALIETLKIEFTQGLNIITGETGAGKSIILGALGLVMGKRADLKSLLNKDQKCIIEVTFHPKDLNIKPFFEENDLDFEENIIIRREITPSGKSRAFINDTPCNLDVLQKLTSNLVDIHQQFDTQDIQNPAQQLELIDTLAENTDLKHKYTQAFIEYKQKFKQLEELKSISSQAQKDLDYYSFQLTELEEACLEDMDQENLEHELNLLERAEEVKEVFSNLVLTLEESSYPVINTLNETINGLSSIAELDKNYGDIESRIISILEELKDISKESQNIADSVEGNEEDLFTIKEKLNKLYNLLKKHQVDNAEDLIILKTNISEKVSQFSNVDAEITKLEKDIDSRHKAIYSLGLEIRKSRKEVVPLFQENVETLLSQLAMNNAKIEVAFTESKNLGQNGIDQLEFMFSANKGSQLQALKSVASGGETSRLALCIKSVLAEKSKLPTMVFDEIDTGVSGEVAQKMGAILLQLSAMHQVVTITHSPQIAAKAKQHFFVYKEDTNERTLTKLKVLDKNGKIEEVAKMISGDPPSQSALIAAEDMILS